MWLFAILSKCLKGLLTIFKKFKECVHNFEQKFKWSVHNFGHIFKESVHNFEQLNLKGAFINWNRHSLLY